MIQIKNCVYLHLLVFKHKAFIVNVYKHRFRGLKVKVTLFYVHKYNIIFLLLIIVMLSIPK